MYFHDDWLIKQIENMTKAIAIFTFHKNKAIYEGTIDSNMQDAELYNTLQPLIGEKNLCRAEDFLFESINSTNLQHLEIAVDFYQTLNLLSDKELEACGFTREEICEGLKALAHIYAVDDCLLIVAIVWREHYIIDLNVIVSGTKIHTHIVDQRRDFIDCENF